MVQMRSSYDINNKRTFIKDINIPIPKTEEYLFNDTTFTVDVDAPGIYMLEFDSTPKLESYGINANYFYSLQIWPHSLDYHLRINTICLW